MAEIRVENLHKTFGDFTAVQNSSFTVEDGEFFVHARAVGLRQDHDAADDRRARAADLRPHPARRRGRHLQARPRARHRLRVPAVRALPAHERAQEHRLPAASARACRAPRSAPRVEETAQAPAHRPSARPPGLAASPAATASASRSAAPSSAGPRLPDGRAARHARRRVPRPDVHELRELHNRIDATTVYVTHDQLEAMAMADKIAVMNHGIIEQFGTPREIYDRPAHHVRRRLHRLAADELPALQRRPRAGRRRRRDPRRRDRACRRCARTSPPADLALASGPSTSGFDDASRLRGEVFGAEYLGTTQIVTVDDRRTACVKARIPADAARHASASTVGLALRRPSACRSSTRPSGRAIETALYEEPAHG